eukprot:10392-Eustigmatos_ZCMA.PRE.1
MWSSHGARPRRDGSMAKRVWRIHLLDSGDMSTGMQESLYPNTACIEGKSQPESDICVLVELSD